MERAGIPGADTAMGSGATQFPPTAWSLIETLRDPGDPRAQASLDRIVASYWRPVYKFVRIGWKRSNEDAKDLTQAFFVHLLEDGVLARADPERGNFRKFLMAILRNFLANEARAGKAAKRGGDRRILSLDGDADDGWASDPADPEAIFEEQWARDILSRSLDRLPGRCRPEGVAAFRRFHLENVPVKEIARELRIAETHVAHHLRDGREALRELVLEEIREYVHEEAEVARELDRLFRAWR